MAHDPHRFGGGAGRVARAWRTLTPDRRLAAYAAAGLFVTLFLPWYDDTIVAIGRTASASLSGWQAFSFVEAAVLLVAVGVLVLLFQRAEGRAFHVPGGDGGAITAAGVWAAALVVWRIFDKQGVAVHGPGTTVSGIHWGIFLALATALLLAYAGSRIRAAHAPEPHLPGEDEPVPEARVWDARVGAVSGGASQPAQGAVASPAPSAAAASPSPPLIPERRPHGWLTAAPRHQQVDGADAAARGAQPARGPAKPQRDPEPARRSAPRPQPTPKPARPPKPPAPDEQLTIPLEDHRSP